MSVQDRLVNISPFALRTTSYPLSGPRPNHGPAVHARMRAVSHPITISIAILAYLAFALNHVRNITKAPWTVMS